MAEDAKGFYLELIVWRCEQCTIIYIPLQIFFLKILN